MFLSELQDKDIISIKDGRRLGHIIDAEIDHEGKILSLLIEEKRNLKRLFSSEESKISFTNITKIGDDVILVDL